MCRSALHPLLEALPKCEHHLHLEGALSPSLLFKLAERNSIALPKVHVDSSFASPQALLLRYNQFTSLDDFLHYYFIGMECLIHPIDFEELALDYFGKAKVDGVVHAELFFDPQAHTSRGIAYDAIIDGFTAACRKAEQSFGISALLIPCFLRHLPVIDAQKTFDEIKGDLVSGKLAGIGLDSSEIGYPPNSWKDIYSKAKASNVRRTAHAGEEGPVDYIREAIRELDVERIDHGIRLAEDPELMHEVAKKQIMVTVCPLSNVRLKCVQDVSGLPIRQFLDNGIRFSLNGDDPAYFGGYILDNYCAVQEAFDLELDDWKWIAHGAVDGSWCDEARKKEIKYRLEEVFANHR